MQRGSTGGDLLGEDRRVDRLGRHHQPVRPPVRSGDDAVAEEAPQPGDVALQGLHGGVGRCAVPDPVDEHTARDVSVGRQQQHREERAMAGRADRHSALFGGHLQRSEQAEPQIVGHPSRLPAGTAADNAVS
jgi:hypothetical protein